MNNSKKQNQIILLTGATGFLGSNILNDLIAKTGNKIIVLKRSTSETKFINQALKSKNTIAYDIDKIDIEEIFKSNKIETIIHCATTYGRGDRATIQVAKSNIVFPLELLIYALKYNVKNFINTDSYSNKENLKYFPEELIDYSLSKQSLILWLKYYSEKIKIINIILEHPFGKNDNNKKFVQSTIEKIAIEKVNSLDFTKGTQLRDFIYIKDITSAYLKILEK